MPACSWISTPGSTAAAGSVTSLLLLHEVQNREEENPDEVDEMPVKAGDLDAVRVALRLFDPHLRARSCEIEKHDDAAENVQTVQAGHREVDREEVVRLRKTAFLKFVRVLEALRGQEDQRAKDGRRNVDAALLEITEPQMRPRHDDGHARQNEDEGVERGQLYV